MAIFNSYVKLPEGNMEVAKQPQKIEPIDWSRVLEILVNRLPYLNIFIASLEQWSCHSTIFGVIVLRKGITTTQPPGLPIGRITLVMDGDGKAGVHRFVFRMTLRQLSFPTREFTQKLSFYSTPCFFTRYLLCFPDLSGVKSYATGPRN